MVCVFLLENNQSFRTKDRKKKNLLAMVASGLMGLSLIFIFSVLSKFSAKNLWLGEIIILNH